MADELNEGELRFIREAAHFFEKPSAMMKGLSWVGRRLENTQKFIPQKIRTSILEASHKAIEKALWVALKTVKPNAEEHFFPTALEKIKASKKIHISMAASAGFIGGFFGIVSALIELPLVTVLLLRSIAEVAQDFDFDLSDPAVALQCLYVFSLGTEAPADDALSSSYYASRLAYSQMMKGAAAYIAKNSLPEIMNAVKSGTAPALIRFTAQVAEHFEIDVSRKLLAQSAPLAGALGGALINSLFTDYYLLCARYHFGLNRLEQERGYEKVRGIFENERQKLKA